MLASWGVRSLHPAGDRVNGTRGFGGDRRMPAVEWLVGLSESFVGGKMRPMLDVVV